MINFLVKTLINTQIPHTSTSVEEYLYDKEVYPFYISTKDSFNFAIKNGFLSRKDILQLKEMLNKALIKRRHLKDFRFKNFENDAHEIYAKLKCKYLSRKQLKKINKFICKVVKSQQRTIASSTLTQISQP